MGKTKKVMFSIRMEPTCIAALDEVAKAQRISRSKLLREFAENATSLYHFLRTEKERQEIEKIRLDGNLSQWVIEHSPSGVDSKMMHFLSNVMRHAAELREAQERGSQKSE